MKWEKSRFKGRIDAQGRLHLDVPPAEYIRMATLNHLPDKYLRACLRGEESLTHSWRLQKVLEDHLVRAKDLRKRRGQLKNESKPNLPREKGAILAPKHLNAQLQETLPWLKSFRLSPNKYDMVKLERMSWYTDDVRNYIVTMGWGWIGRVWQKPDRLWILDGKHLVLDRLNGVVLVLLAPGSDTKVVMRLMKEPNR